MAGVPPAPTEGVVARDGSPFRYGRVGDTTVVALPTLFNALSQRITTHHTLYDWAAEAPQARALQGRGVVFVAHMEECDATVVVRHSWHGGLFAPLTGDRFLAPTRAPREAAANVLLRTHGVPTPELIGYALYPAGPAMRRVDVVSRFIPDAWDFGAVLTGSAPGIDRESACHAILPLLAQLAAVGAVHRDLNVKNILLVRDGAGLLHAWVLDVDVVSFRQVAAESVMAMNVQRLTRSIRKWHRRHELPLDAPWLTGFAESALASTR